MYLAPRWGALQVPRKKESEKEIPIYIMLGSLTQKGIENIKDSPKRVEDAKKLFKPLGGEIKQFYYTMGQYDFVAITEFPSDEAATKAILLNAIGGNARTETLKGTSYSSSTVKTASTPPKATMGKL